MDLRDHQRGTALVVAWSDEIKQFIKEYLEVPQMNP